MSEKLEVVYGIHSVTQTLRNKKRMSHILYVLDGKAGHKAVEDIIRLAKAANVKIERMEPKIMDALTKNSNHQGVALKVEPLKMLRFNEALREAEGRKNDLWLAVDEMTDPQNLGSIIRSAACLGFSTVILPTRRTVGLTPAVYKVASGGVEAVNIVEVVNLNTALLDLKEEGYWIYGADMAGKNCVKFKYNMPAVLVIGSEGTGLREKTKEHCDELVSIPQADNGIDSLNAASAAAVLMYDLRAKSFK